MSKKRSGSQGRLVYSTDPNFILPEKNTEDQETLPPSLQQITVRLDKRNRAGKAVTLVEGFSGTTSGREALGKMLKMFCGTGGSVKGSEIIIQGDNRDKVFQCLHQKGYSSVKKL